MNYEILDHTADASVRVYGKSFEEILRSSALAMMDLITDRETVQPEQEIEIEAMGETDEGVLVNWLQEVLFQHQVKKMFFCEFEVEMIDENRVKGKAFGEKINPEKHEFGTEIKGISYHGLKLERVNDRLETDIIFDI